MLNLVVLSGLVARPASVTTLPSGDRLLSLDVSVRTGESGKSEPVPVVWSDPPTWAAELEAGAAVAVLGRVRRRFFRSGGLTQSRTEVIASRVVPGGTRRRVAALLAEAADLLSEPAALSSAAAPAGAASGGVKTPAAGSSAKRRPPGA